MKRLLVLAVLVASGALCAGEREYLWPKGKMPAYQPHQIAALTNEKEKGKEPYIEWQDAPKGGYKTDTCVILISGGSYMNQCDVGLVTEWWPRVLGAEGVRTVNLVHRTPRPHGLPYYMTAWIDGQRAVRLVRAQAEKRGFNPEKIVVMGMSAGAHLTALLATSSQTPAYEPVDDLDKVPCHVNLANTFALAYDSRDGLGQAGFHFPHIMADPKRVAQEPAFKFDAKTAPMCMTHGGADGYMPHSSTYVYRQLRKMKVPAELHIYPNRGHGAHGIDCVMEFMCQMGFLGKLAPEESLMKRYAGDDARATYEKKNIWPEGKMPSVQAKQCTPYLEWHLPKTLKTKAIQIIWSGGGYGGNGPDWFEVAPMRRFLNEKGMAVVTVKYRTPRPAKPLAKHVTAWQDVQRVIRIVRSEAAARGLDPNRIGVMGSSAGGHLALMAGTSSMLNAYEPIDELDTTVRCNVQWVIGVYPAYALTDGIDRPNVDGGNLDDSELVEEFLFDRRTPPMYFVHGDADGWAAMNSVKAWEQLRAQNIQSELHTLATRNHCFQNKAAPGTGSYTWMDHIWGFLGGFAKEK